MSERRICRVLGQRRSTQRKRPAGRADEDCLVADIIALTREHGVAVTGVSQICSELLVGM